MRTVESNVKRSGIYQSVESINHREPMWNSRIRDTNAFFSTSNQFLGSRVCGVTRIRPLKLVVCMVQTQVTFPLRLAECGSFLANHACGNAE